MKTGRSAVKAKKMAVRAEVAGKVEKTYMGKIGVTRIYTNKKIKWPVENPQQRQRMPLYRLRLRN